MNCLLALCFVALSFSAYSISFPEEGEVWWKELYFEVDWECDVNETRLLVVCKTCVVC
jgi:hypothetical protein